MYARMLTVQANHDKLEEAVALFKHSFVPATKQQKGFVSLTLLGNRKAGKGIVITLWKTEADLRAGDASGYLQEQAAKFAGVFAGPLIQEEYEVAAHS